MAAKRTFIGFVGQGYVGKNYADDFESRDNKNKIQDCDVVFVAVPTPSTPKGFDLGIVDAALSLVGKGNIAVIKSTITPGSTRALQKRHPKITVLFCPEFLSVATARYDVENPFLNAVGMPENSPRHKKAAEFVLSILKKAPENFACTSDEAELIKYAHNISGYMQILTFNTLYDVAEKLRANWSPIQRAIESDPLVCNRYANPLHKGGRGAGGFCFIKDMAAFAQSYERLVKDSAGIAFLNAAQKKNVALLVNSKKDLDLLRGVYGASAVMKKKR